MKFDLWDVETSKYFGHFDDESEALVLVRTLVSNLGPSYADDLELGVITGEGEVLESLSGAALIARADEVIALKALDEIGAALKEQGLTLEDMIESGRKIREELYREQYGHLDTNRS